jgi:predicted flap endonuclease-1-like 5' DNA nuclease
MAGGGLLDYNHRATVRVLAGPACLSHTLTLVAVALNVPFALLGLIIVLAAFGFGYVAGRRRRAAGEPAAPPAPRAPTPSIPDHASDRMIAERARIIRSYEAEAARLRARLSGELAAARAETARYRQLVLDIEENAPPPLFGPGAPDDLKLIVGVGPVLERMLHQLGVTTYRQVAHWSERDIDEFDARLPEFPGRIRRDGWVTQARELHQSKYGETLPPRGR